VYGWVCALGGKLKLKCACEHSECMAKTKGEEGAGVRVIRIGRVAHFLSRIVGERRGL